MAIRPRTSLCLQCRTALFEGEPCDQDSEHATASMADIYGREALIAAVWGPVREREHQIRTDIRRQQSLSGLTTIGATVGVVTMGLLGPVGGVAMLFGGVASGTLFWSCGRFVLGKKQHTYPVGAEPLVVRRGLSARGHIRGSAALLSPASATECVAYALELRCEGYWGDRVMFRDAVTAGFEVELDGGSTARIPAGRIRLLGAMHQEIDLDNIGLDDYLKAFDPQHEPNAYFDPLRYNVVYEQVLVPGDRIELVSPFELVVGDSPALTLYRDGAPSVLEPRGVPMLRLCADRP